MEIREFLDNIKINENLFEIFDETIEKYLILNKKSQKKYEINKNILKEANWKNVKEVLEGREPVILDGITRIVGYFSKTSNWNKSKIGELHDRREGNYKIGNC